MYSIHTYLWGVQLPDQMNEKFQQLELSEVKFDDRLQELCRSYEMEFDIPYSGDGTPGLHFGIYLDSTEAHIGKGTAPMPKEPDDVEKAKFLEFRNALCQLITDIYDEWDEEEPLDFESSVAAAHVLQYLMNTEPSIYSAYSTS